VRRTGITALLVAAERSDLVRALVVVDASPTGTDEESAADQAAEVGEALTRWPVPFRTREAALEFFGGSSLAAMAWADGLEEREDGLWPRFEIDVMVRTLREAVTQSHWEAWESIRCPTLIVRAENGLLVPGDARAMGERLPTAHLVELKGAKHDLHLDRPQEWRRALSHFLRQVNSWHDSRQTIE